MSKIYLTSEDGTYHYVFEPKPNNIDKEIIPDWRLIRIRDAPKAYWRKRYKIRYILRGTMSESKRAEFEHIVREGYRWKLFIPDLPTYTKTDNWGKYAREISDWVVITNVKFPYREGKKSLTTAPDEAAVDYIITLEVCREP